MRTIYLIFSGFVLAGLLSPPSSILAQSGREKVLEGNRRFSEGRYEQALDLYQKALEESPDSSTIQFNLGDAFFKKDDLEGAADSFSNALKSEHPELNSSAQYNLGNTFYRQGKLRESLSAYREALRLAPEDRDAKHNLEFVQKELKKKEQQQEESQQDDSENQQDEKENQEKIEQKETKDQQNQKENESQNQDQQKEENSRNKQQSQDNKSENQEDRPQAQGGDQQHESVQDNQEASGAAKPMSLENAERLLEALAEGQSSIRKKTVVTNDSLKVEKDW